MLFPPIQREREKERYAKLVLKLSTKLIKNIIVFKLNIIFT